MSPTEQPPLTDIPYASAAQLTGAYHDGRLSPVAVATELLDRIERLGGAVNAFVFVDRDATLAMALESERRWRRAAPLGPLDGVPVTVKDLVAVAGWPLVRGSLALKGTAPPLEDAPAVARLREAGAVLLAKTATSEAGSKIVTRSPAHGVTRNPYDLTRTPGGSSGGAAVALALGIGPIALGTDGAGSIRIPAAWTGVFGIKPSFGRVPTYPPSIFMPHSVIGPMARDVESARLMLGVLSQADRRDPFALPYPFDEKRAAMRSVAGLRVGVTTDFGVTSPPVDPAILGGIAAAAAHLERAGATLSELRPAWPCDPFEPFMIFWEATYAGFMANTYSAQQIALMDPDLQAIAARGRQIDTVRYHKALMQRVALAAYAKRLLTEFDVLLGPVMPCLAPTIERDAPDGHEPGDWRWCPFNYVWNMTAHPAAAVPWGMDRGKLPVGLQLVGAVGGEPDLLRTAAVLEAAAAATPRPPASAH